MLNLTPSFVVCYQFLAVHVEVELIFWLLRIVCCFSWQFFVLLLFILISSSELLAFIAVAVFVTSIKIHDFALLILFFYFFLFFLAVYFCRLNTLFSLALLFDSTHLCLLVIFLAWRLFKHTLCASKVHIEFHFC